MKPTERSLELTDLERERPTTRGSDAPKRKKGGTKVKAGAGRMNQIAVGAATAKASYAVDERPDPHDLAAPPVQTSRPPVKQRPIPLQRSQTAPSGTKQPRQAAAAATDNPPASRSRNEHGRVLVKPAAAASTRRAAAAPSKPGSDPARPYGEMLDSDDVVALCWRLGMTPKELWQLLKEFNDEDTSTSNTITQSSFFYLIHEEPRALTTCVLRLAALETSLDATSRLTFDEYVRCVATFASFTEPELLQFYFRVYCETATDATTRASTAMAEGDLLKLSQDLQVLRSAFVGNIQVATTNAVAAAGHGSDLHGALTFADFERFSRQHRVAFYPLLQIQRNVRQAGELGEAFWSQKTMEKQQLTHVLAYMKRNLGKQPPLSLRDRIVWFVLRRSTTEMRVRERANQLYAS